MVTNYETLLDGVDYNKIEFHDNPFEFNIESYENDYTIEKLKDNSKFNKNLSNNELFISNFVNTKDFDTYTIGDIKYLLIHKRLNRKLNMLEKLGDPEYIIFQSKDINDKWDRDNIKIFKINNNFKYFYNKLISKIIEIIKDDKSYIYVSNGNNWILKNIENKTEEFKDILRSEELKKMISQKNLKIKII
jgi:hypothetical protein